MRLASRDNSVAGNELGEDTTSSLDTEGKCGDVDENEILSAFLPREDTTLNSSTICDSLIRVDTLGRVSATEELLEKLLDLGYTSGTANEYDLIRDIRNLNTRPLRSIRTSSISSFFTFASLRTCSTGFMVLRKRSRLSSSNLARVSVSEKSFPSSKDSISRRVDCWEERVRFAFSTSRLSLPNARRLVEMSVPVFFLYCLTKYSMRRLSKSSPPRWVSPAVAKTSKTPSSIERRETSNVPPPRS